MVVPIIPAKKQDESIMPNSKKTMKKYDKNNLKEFAQDLKEFIEKGVPGDSIEVGLDPSLGLFDEVNYTTIINHKTGKAVLIHAACSGDRTRAMLIPEEDFGYDDLSTVVEALDYHIYRHENRT